MFTGIVDHAGTLSAMATTSKGLRFTIDTQFEDLQLGESITVDGVCLTVTDCSEHTFSCDISPETLQRTRFHTYQPGSLVNLERSLQLGDRLGGHYVTGHVDQTALIKNIIQHDDYIEMHIAGFDLTHAAYLIPKGSITINGVSLTINNIIASPLEIQLMLIPHTLAMTNLKQCKVNDIVNIEFDYYAKTIAHQVALYLQHQEIHHVS